MGEWIWDDDEGVFVDSDDGTVVDEDGNFLGSYEEYFDIDDTSAGVSQQDYEAIATAVGEDYKDALADLRSEVEDMRLEEAHKAGAQSVWQQADDGIQEDQRDDHDWSESITTLADKLGRRITNAEAARIESLMPDEYTDEDISRAAEQLNIKSFHDAGRTAMRDGGRQQRVNYLSDRFNEAESGEYVHDPGDRSSDAARAARENRFAQGTALPEPPPSRSEFDQMFTRSGDNE